MRDFLNLLDTKGLLTKIKKPVDVKYELPTLLKLFDGKPVLFENPKGYDMPVCGNLCSTRDLISLGLGIDRRNLIAAISKAIENPKKPEIKKPVNFQEIPPNLDSLPILTYYPSDGGPYIASAIVLAKDREYGINASYHRMMKMGSDKLVLRILPRDFDKFIERGLKEFAICIGNSIQTLVASAISPGIGVSELDIANAIKPIRILDFEGHLVPDAEIVMLAEFTGEWVNEGPFLDLTETPDLVRSQRVARIKRIFVKDKPIFQAILPGGLEHKHLMGMPREPTIFREVNRVCKCKDVLITPGGCSWLHGVVSIQKNKPEDGKNAIEAALKGHSSMKHVWVVDEDIDISDPNQVEWAMATRFQGDRDMVIKHEKGSSLDPSSDLQTRMTTKIGFDLTIPLDRDIKSFKKLDLPMKLNPEDYTTG
jgi:UbiD family decarboxylase